MMEFGLKVFVLVILFFNTTRASAVQSESNAADPDPNEDADLTTVSRSYKHIAMDCNELHIVWIYTFWDSHHCRTRIIIFICFNIVRVEKKNEKIDKLHCLKVNRF